MHAMSTLQYLDKGPTNKQRIQRELAWKLKMVTGARGNLYPREKNLHPSVESRLYLICNELKIVEDQIRFQLANIK